MTGSIDFDAIRAANPLPQVAGRVVKLQRAGSELKGLCPFHKEKSPSFTIFAGGDRFHCFGCAAGGDVVDFVRLLDGSSYREAAERLKAGAVPKATIPSHLPAAEPKRTKTAAGRIWQQAVAAPGTPVAAYLKARGLSCPIPPAIRFSRLSYPDLQGDYPCMVALVTGPDGPQGIQRTYLREDGGGKADVETPKLSLGRIGGGAVRLGEPASEIVVSGGIEDGLSLQWLLKMPAFAVTGEAMMARLVLPDCVRSVCIGADNDAAGDLAARNAASAYVEQGREARIFRPRPDFNDWNAELMAALERKAA